MDASSTFLLHFILPLSLLHTHMRARAHSHCYIYAVGYIAGPVASNLSRVEVPLKVKGNAVRNLEVPMPEQIERFGKIIALFTDPSFQQDVLLLNAVNRTAGPKRQFWICALEQF